MSKSHIIYFGGGVFSYVGEVHKCRDFPIFVINFKLKKKIVIGWP